MLFSVLTESVQTVSINVWPLVEMLLLVTLYNTVPFVNSNSWPVLISAFTKACLYSKVNARLTNMN